MDESLQPFFPPDWGEDLRFRVVVGVNAGVVLVLGLALLVTLAPSFLYRDGSWDSFVIPAAVMIPLGVAGLWASRLPRGVGYVPERDVYLSVTLAWVVAALLAGVPFLIGGTFDTTGFVTADFDKRATSAKLAPVMLMFAGGCAGSTARGIEVIRVVVIFRTVLQGVFRMVHPRAVTPLTLGRPVVPEGVRLAVLGLIFAAWIAIFAVAAFLVALQEDLTLTSSVTAVAATLNVIGPGLGQVGASESFEIVDPFGRVVLTVCMLLGRLEILTALALLSPAFWRR